MKRQQTTTKEQREQQASDVVEKSTQKAAEKTRKKLGKGAKPNFKIGDTVLIQLPEERNKRIKAKNLTTPLYPYSGSITEIHASGFSVKVKWIQAPPGSSEGDVCGRWFSGRHVKIPVKPQALITPSIGVVTFPSLMQDSPDFARISTSLFNSATTTPEIKSRNESLQSEMEITTTASTTPSNEMIHVVTTDSLDSACK